MSTGPACGGAPGGAAGGGRAAAMLRSSCEGHGGSAPQAAGDRPTHVSRAGRNGLERGMKGGIIMACPCHADRKTSPLHMLETDARLALIQDWLTSALRLAVARGRTGLQRRQFSALFPRFYAGRDLHRHGCAGGQGGRAALPQGHARCWSPSACTCRTCTPQDVARGLLLLEDLGTTPYLARLAAGDDPEPLYADALAALVKIQVGGAAASADACALWARASSRARWP